MECLPVAKISEGDAWIYELKLDGYRAQAIRDGKGVRILSRNGKDLTKKYPLLVRDLKEAIDSDTALDGELVAFDDAGHPSLSSIVRVVSSMMLLDQRGRNK
jgi:ATP-dependent DNA ligase